MNRLLAAIAAFALVACNAVVPVGGSDAGDASTSDVLACITAGQPCSAASACCAGLACTPSTSGASLCVAASTDAGNDVQPSNDAAPMTDAQPSDDAAMCASAGHLCTGATTCCSGLSCYGLSGSGPGRCDAPDADHVHTCAVTGLPACAGGEPCQTGTCPDGVHIVSCQCSSSGTLMACTGACP